MHKGFGFPLFFKLWFAFCVLLGLSIMAATVAILLNPEWIGEFVGRILAGFQSVNPAINNPPVVISTG